MLPIRVIISTEYFHLSSVFTPGSSNGLITYSPLLSPKEARDHERPLEARLVRGGQTGLSTIATVYPFIPGPPT